MNDILEEFVIYNTVKVGEKGQVILPSRARNEFHTKADDLLLIVRATNTRGLGLSLLKADLVKAFVERLIKRMEIRGNRRAQGNDKCDKYYC